MKTRLHLLFAGGIILLFLGLFFRESLGYRPFADDLDFIAAVKTMDVPEVAVAFFENSNGRLFSHFYLCTVFSVFHSGSFFIYHFMLLAAFVFSLAALLRNYLHSVNGRKISRSGSLFYALLIAAFLFFFIIENSFETWFWISATGVYLVSLIVAMCGFAVLFSEQKAAVKLPAAFVLFLLAGGFSESFAVMYVILLLALCRKKSFRIVALPAIAGIMIGLSLHLFSAGREARLEQLPDFTVLQALKNTIHSLAFPLLRYELLPIKILPIVFFVFFVKSQNAFTFHLSPLIRRAAFTLVFIAISFFIPCYLLSDIVPERAASLGYFAGVLFLFDSFVFRPATPNTPNPL